MRLQEQLTRARSGSDVPAASGGSVSSLSLSSSAVGSEDSESAGNMCVCYVVWCINAVLLPILSFFDLFSIVYYLMFLLITFYCVADSTSPRPHAGSGAAPPVVKKTLF